MWVQYTCQPALPIASQIHTLRQVRNVMSQRIAAIHLQGSVAMQNQVEISFFMTSQSGIRQQVTQRRRGHVLQRNAPGHFHEDVDHREDKGHTIVLSFQIRQVDEIGLPLLTWTSHDNVSSPEMTSRSFV